jgi:putative sterol carrier protein
MPEARSAREFFETLATRVPPEGAADLTNSYLFDITGAGTWHVTVDRGAVTVTEEDAPADVRIRMSEDTFAKLLGGEQNPMRLLFTGKIKVQGDMGAATRLQKLLG